MEKVNIKNIITRSLWVAGLVLIGYCFSYYNHVYRFSKESGIPQACVAQYNFAVALTKRVQECEENLITIVELAEECADAILECKE